MGLGTRVDGGGGGGPAIPVRIRKTIQFIKEFVGNHSDAEIYAALKETGMDPNEAAQKLLNEDPFHEVRRKRDKKKESLSYDASVELTKHSENTTQWTRSQTTFARNSRRGGYARNTPPGISHEFRVVRDNRVNQNSYEDADHESIHYTRSGGEPPTSNFLEKRDSKMQSHGSNVLPGSDPDHAKGSDLGGAHNQLKEVHETGPKFASVTQKMVTQNSEKRSATLVSSSAIGVYSSSSDPVHVPSPDSRTAGTVGAIRREVGVVGVRRPPSELSTSPSTAPNNSFSVPSGVNDASIPVESTGQVPALSKSKATLFGQNLESEPIVSGTPVGRSFPTSQCSTKMHQQPVGHQKATQSNMEWKPKLSQKPNTSASGVVNEAATKALAHVDSSTGPNVEVISLSDKLSQVSIYENEHVIIPQHLRVPEAERAHLTFGSFEVGFDSPKDFMSAIQEFGDLKASINEQSICTSASDSVVCNQDVSTGHKVDSTDGPMRTSQSDSPASVLASEETSYENSDSLRVQNTENYTEMGLLQSNSPSHSPREQHQLENPPNFPSYSEAYDTQNNYDVPFFRTAMEDTVHRQGLASPPEALSSHVANGSVPSTIATVQHQQPLAQQQHMAQLYPPVQFPHFASYLPYRQLLSPMYVPSMAVPNFSSNPPYPHPTNGSGYVLMPGGNSQLSAAGMKYATSQYKPVPTSSPIGYGNYTNPSGYPIGGPGTVGATTSLDDVARIKYKDNSFFLPNAQAETPELWVQSPRDLPGMQSAPYFNVPGQVQHAAYMPTHSSHASFNAAPQSSHIIHGLYQTPQPAAPIASPHHLVHQQVLPGMSGNVGVGVAAPAPQIGTYQQPQLGHPSWTGNF